jgi:hypothetical protein
MSIELNNDDLELIISSLKHFQMTRSEHNPTKHDIQKTYDKLINAYPNLKSKFENGFTRY